MTYKHEFILAGLPRMPNRVGTRGGSGMRLWREGEQWKKDVWAMCSGLNKPRAPLNKARVTFTRSAHGPEPDSDGLAHSFKPVRDGLVKCGVLVDDSPAHIEAIYQWEQGRYKKGFIRVTIEEIS